MFNKEHGSHAEMLWADLRRNKKRPTENTPQNEKKLTILRAGMAYTPKT